MRERDPEAPPSDPLAEAVVLHHLLMWPSDLQTHEVGRLLTVPRHKTVYELMRAAALRTRGQSHTAFYIDWMKACEARETNLSDALDDVLIDRGEWLFGRRDDLEFEPWRGLWLQSDDWTFWLDRLERAYQARQLVSAIQDIASRVWASPDAEYGIDQAIQRLKQLSPETSDAGDTEDSLVGALGFD